ncbi:hypothetical protein [Nostoc sp.]
MSPIIPFFCEAAYNSPPGYRRPPDALGELQGLAVQYRDSESV